MLLSRADSGLVIYTPAGSAEDRFHARGTMTPCQALVDFCVAWPSCWEAASERHPMPEKPFLRRRA